ncbi:MAG: hypothetical protein R3F20_19705 [Planctomycetota bacterium]
MRNPSDDPKRTTPPDVRADFDAEDEALWSLLGAVDEVAPTRSFVSRTVDRARAERRAAETRPLFRRPWLATGLTAAAAIVGAIVIFGRPGDDATRESTQAPVATNDISDVVDILSNLGDDDLLVLEARDAEAVQDEYLGG